MKGTEKQIAWANDLRRMALEAIDAGMQVVTSDARYDESNPKHAAVTAIWARRRENIEHCDKAWVLIDELKVLSDHRTALENFAEINCWIRMSANKYFDK